MTADPTSASLPEWTPDLPLRADATDAQMRQREAWLWEKHDYSGLQKWWTVAREFAAACVADANPRMPAFDADGEPIQRTLVAVAPARSSAGTPTRADIAKALADAINFQHDTVEECTCADAEFDTLCWYRLTAEQKSESRIATLADKLFTLFASLPARSDVPGEVPEDERCSDCMEARATVAYESGDDRCEACAKILDERMKERDRITEWAARQCEKLLTGFKSDLHEAYDNGVRECAKAIRDPNHDAALRAGSQTGGKV